MILLNNEERFESEAKQTTVQRRGDILENGVVTHSFYFDSSWLNLESPEAVSQLESVGAFFRDVKAVQADIHSQLKSAPRTYGKITSIDFGLIQPGLDEPYEKFTLFTGVMAFGNYKEVETKAYLLNNHSQEEIVTELNELADTASRELRAQFFGATDENVEALLDADVVMTNPNQFYDGPALTLKPGKWHIDGALTVASPVGAAIQATIKLYDGNATVWRSGSAGQAAILANIGVVCIPVSATIVLEQTTAVKLAAASMFVGAKIKAACPVNPVGNNASYLNAVRLG